MASSAQFSEIPRPPLSGEPLINAIHRRLLDLLLAGIIFFVVYACFVPFDFARPVDRSNDAGWYLGLRLVPISLPDILANISIYLPVGALACAVLRRRGLRRFTSMALLLPAGVLLSITVEYGQHFVRSRVPSWVDVTSNAAGILLGAGFVVLFEGALRRRAAGAMDEARRHWWRIVGRIAVCAVLIIQLRPYDVVVDCFHTAAEVYRHGKFDPLARWISVSGAATISSDGGNTWSREQWEYVLDRVADFSVYAALAAIVLLGTYHQRRSRIGSIFRAGMVVSTVAMLVTGVRILLISHGLDTAHFACALLGWPVGGIVGLIAARQRTAPRKVAQSRRWPWVALAAIVLFMVAMYETVPFNVDVQGTETLGEVCLFPFLAHFHSKPNVALYDITGDILRYAFFGAAIAVLLWARYDFGSPPARQIAIRHGDNASEKVPRLRWRFQLALAMGATIMAAGAFEVAHVWMPSRQADVTTILLAIIGSFAGIVAVRWVVDVRRSLAIAFADDLLTHQLIVGETYEPLPAARQKKPGSTASAATEEF